MNTVAQPTFRDMLPSIGLLLGFFTFVYFVIIRPQRKQEKDTASMRSNLKPGDDIMTIGGIYGKIVRIKGDRLTIVSGADKTRLEISIKAVSSLENPSDEPAPKQEKPSAKSIKRLGKSSQEEAEE